MNSRDLKTGLVAFVDVGGQEWTRYSTGHTAQIQTQTQRIMAAVVGRDVGATNSYPRNVDNMAQMPVSDPVVSSSTPFQYQLSHIDRIIQIKAHNRDVVVKKNGNLNEYNLNKSTTAGVHGNNLLNAKSFTYGGNNDYNLNANNNAMNYKGNKGRRQNQSMSQMQNMYQNVNMNTNTNVSMNNQYQSNVNYNQSNVTGQLFTNNNQRKYKYLSNTNNNTKQSYEQQNMYVTNISNPVNLLQQLQKQQHQQQIDQQNQQYGLNQNTNLLESFLIQQLNNQSQVQSQSQSTQSYLNLQQNTNSYDSISQSIPNRLNQGTESYNSPTSVMFDYKTLNATNTINSNEMNELINPSSLLSNTNSVPTNNIKNAFTNTNNNMFQHEEVNVKPKLESLPSLNLQSIVDQQQEITSNVTTPGSVTRPNSSITSFGSSVPSSHMNSESQDIKSSTSNTSSKNTLVDPLESIWKRDCGNSSDTTSQILGDFNLENTYFNNTDKLKESGIFGSYFS